MATDGYFTNAGFVGFVGNRKMLFATYTDYVEFMEEHLEDQSEQVEPA